MKGWHLLLLVCLLGGLVAIGIALKSRRDPTNLEAQLKLRTFMPEYVLKDQITAIELSIGMENPAVVLERNQGAWHIVSGWNAPADAEIVKKFLNSFYALRGDKPVTSEGVYADFGVDATHGMHVRLFAAERGVPVVDLLVGGKRKNFYENSFARLAGEATVYQASIDVRGEVGLYNTELTKPPANRFWLDTTPVTIEKGSLKQISISYPEHRLVFRKLVRRLPMPVAANDIQDATWELLSGGPGGAVRVDKLRQLITDIERFNINDALDPSMKKEYGLDRPGYRLVITFTDDRVLAVDAARSRGGRPYIAISTMQGHLFSIPRWRFDEIFARGSMLFDLKRPFIDTGQLTRLVLTRSGEKVVLARKTKKEEWWTSSGGKLNNKVIISLLSALSNWKPDDYADQDSVAEYGFAAPRAVLEVDIGSKGTLKLYLGNDHPTWLGAYVRAGDEGQTLVMEDNDVKRVFPGLNELTVKDEEND